ncbi:hypothetical protein ACTFIW_002777 [Dictyostelium discoideum]
MDIYYILNHDYLDNNIFDFENNSDTIDIGKNYEKGNSHGLMLPPPTFITPSNQNDTITYYTSGRSISVPRKMLIDPNTITDCGSNGIMFIAFNYETKKRVILKKLSRIFDNELNGHRIIKNLVFQNLLQGGKHISTYQSIFKRKCSDSYEPPLTSILNSIVNSNDNPPQHSTLIQQKDDEDFYFESIQPQYSLMNLIENNLLDQDDICKLFYEILMGLKYMHSAGVIHRDLDPENSIFVDENFNIQFTEFSNCFLLDSNQKFLFKKEYITNSYSYRAPETIWGDSFYTEATDVWGAGVLFAELLLGKRLFTSFTGRSQLTLINDLIGPPKSAERNYIKKRELLNFLRGYNRSFGFKPTFNNTFVNCSQIQINLLNKMLCWDPRDRPSVNEILDSPYFEKIRDRTNFIPCYKKLNVDIHFDILNLKPNEMVDIIDQEFLNPC